MKFSILAAGLAFAAAPAMANTVVVNHVYDPANILLANLTGETLAVPFTMAAGDTLDLTITFTGGQSVTANGEDGLWMLAMTSGPGGTLNTSGTLEFLGASGNVVSGPIPLNQDNNFIHVGSYYSSSNYRLDPNPITFTGLRQIITINADDIGVPREYTRVVLTHFSGSIVGNGDVGGVPEPATWAMMIAGFGLVGAAARRRRAVGVSA